MCEMRRCMLDTLVFDCDQRDFIVRSHGADHSASARITRSRWQRPNPIEASILGLNAAELLGLSVLGK